MKVLRIASWAIVAWFLTLTASIATAQELIGPATIDLKLDTSVLQARLVRIEQSQQEQSAAVNARLVEIEVKLADIITRLKALEADEPVPDPDDPVPDPDDPVPPPSGDLFDPATDLEFLGIFRMPNPMFERSTAFSAGCLAFRRVNGQERLLTDGHIGTGGKLYEVAVPEKFGQKVTATVVKEYGHALYGVMPLPSGGDTPAYVTGLKFVDASTLYVNFGSPYTLSRSETQTVMISRLDGETLIDSTLPDVGGSSDYRRGGSLQIPEPYATTLGSNVGVGFGGYYPLFGGSWGPALLVNKKLILGYPHDPNDNRTKRCYRPPDYFMCSDRIDYWPGANPVDGEGRWTQRDWLGGEWHSSTGLWIGNSIVFTARNGTGRICYENGGGTEEGRIQRWYVYDADDIMAVASGEKQSWEPRPVVHDFVHPEGTWGRGWPGSAAYDEQTGRLYLCVTKATQPASSGGNSYPAVYVYKLAE